MRASTPSSLSRREFLADAGILAIGFTLMGAWLILPFAGLEVLGLGAAYLCYARRFARQDEQAARSDKRPKV